ncbi:probable tetraacyldisaccharide 4'-kinase, mitochondrial [Rutidosis leptorrhynchoides]|uniref:probable tetraacyldisaccharide 4'-kinase, mitochondrial n=1 Tax=Rutidosis leptorrhynchoides TaxID=125765 RepID=UPI003A998127
MEKLRRIVNKIAYTPISKSHTLSPLYLSLIPILFISSKFYNISLFVRRTLYHFNILPKHKLPVPVISVGNLTWGGNGKTPMVEFIANLFLNHVRVSPLILTRLYCEGYGGADEARMLERHFDGTSVKVGVGANRATTAASFIHRYGLICPTEASCFEKPIPESGVVSDKIGVAILDDGMQHISMLRDFELVMVNALSPWGNHQLLPFGPLREPLTSLSRVDAAVIHHADMVSDQSLSVIKSTILEVNPLLPIYLSAMIPSHFLKAPNISCRLPLGLLVDKTVLCVSAIGSPNSFVQRIQKMGPLFIDRVDYSDHHQFQNKDIEMIKARLEDLKSKFGMKPIVVVTEKDYDRDSEILCRLDPFDVLVLCCKLQIIPHNSCSEDSFKKLLIGSLSKDLRIIGKSWRTARPVPSTSTTCFSSEGEKHDTLSLIDWIMRSSLVHLLDWLMAVDAF